MSMFSDLWGLDDDNQDLKQDDERRGGFESSESSESHDHVDSHHRRVKRSKRRLMLGLVGFMLIMGWLWLAIAEAMK